MLNTAIERLRQETANPNTRDAYLRAANAFAAWCTQQGIRRVEDLSPQHLASYVQVLTTNLGPSAVRLRLAGVRAALRFAGLDGLAAITQPLPMMPKARKKCMPAPILQLLEHLEADCSSTRQELRDRALINLLAHIPIDIGLAVELRTEDVIQSAKDRSEFERFGAFRAVDALALRGQSMPLPAKARRCLVDYVDAAELAADASGWLFRTMRRQSDTVSTRRMSRIDAYRALRKRCERARLDKPMTSRDLLRYARQL